MVYRNSKEDMGGSWETEDQKKAIPEDVERTIKADEMVELCHFPVKSLCMSCLKIFFTFSLSSAMVDI